MRTALQIELQVYDFFIIRDEKIAVIIGFSFRFIKFPASGQVIIFCVPEDQIGNAQALSQFTGIFHGTVMLFIWFVPIFLAVQAEGFMEQPDTAFHKGAADRIIRFIPGTGELFSVFQDSSKTELAGFGGVDIKERDRIVQNLFPASVFHGNQQNPFSKQISNAGLYGKTAEGNNRIRKTVMTVKIQISVVFAAQNPGTDHPDQPHHTQNVVCMFMGNKNMMDMVQGDFHIVQEPQDTISASCINEKIFLPVPDGKAGIVTTGHSGVPGSEYIKLFHRETSVAFMVNICFHHSTRIKGMQPLRDGKGKFRKTLWIVLKIYDMIKPLLS